MSGAITKLRCNTSCKEDQCCLPYNMHQVWKTICSWNHQGMNGHREVWKQKRFERSPVAELFWSPEHDFLNRTSLCCLDHNPEWGKLGRAIGSDVWTLYGLMVSTKATSRGNRRSLVRACDSLWRTLCSCDFSESQRKLDLFARSIGEKRSVWCISLSVCCLWRLVCIPYTQA